MIIPKKPKEPVAIEPETGQSPLNPGNNFGTGVALTPGVNFGTNQSVSSGPHTSTPEIDKNIARLKKERP